MNANPGPISRIDPALAYRRPGTVHPVTLRLDGNEGLRPSLDPLIEAMRAAGPELLHRYPNATALEATLARRYGLPPDGVLVTAGADEALDRCCRAYLGPGRALLAADPTFEMFDRYVRLADAERIRVPWPRQAYPIAEMLASIDEHVGIVAVVTPNNPTGQTADADHVRRLATAAPHALLLLDHAYAEYADEDLTRVALELPNAIVVRTFSKAWGLAGARIGYVLGTPALVGCLRACGGPFTVSSTAAAFAALQLERAEPEMRAHVARVRRERTVLSDRLAALGAQPRETQSNFVWADLGPRAKFVHAALAARGILVRAFPERYGTGAGLRITLPDDDDGFSQLVAALELALAPDALLLDMDGVLADVEGSYRACILATAKDYGITLTRHDLLEATHEGHANDDWVLTQRLLAARGVHRSLEEIKARYQAHYEGVDGAPGLREAERLLVTPEELRSFAVRLPVGIVTGRPRAEAERFLTETGIADLVRTVVVKEDGPIKPDPAPVRLAMQRLGAQRPWMIGDTPDDVRAGRAAGALPLGIPAPGESSDWVTPRLLEAGAAVVLQHLRELEPLLPANAPAAREAR